MVEKLYVTYNEVHKLCQESAEKILNDFQPNLMIAIGGGGYVPARILRSFLKKPGAKNIPIQAIGLSLYEELGDDEDGDGSSAPETPGTQVKRTQWLDFSSLTTASLVGKNVLIVDEVDDTRTTLDYALRELQKDVRELYARDGVEPSAQKTKFAIFVLHNKQKTKKGTLPEDLFANNRYLAARNVGDVWINYPWEAMDIDEHDSHALAGQQK